MSASWHQPRIHVRIPKESSLKQRLAAVAERTGVPESCLVLRAIEAVVDHVEQTGRIEFPLSVVSAGKGPERAPTAHIKFISKKK